MFRKTVLGICQQFTAQLEIVEQASEKEYSKQKAILDKAVTDMNAANEEAEAAARAIDNIKELFGQ